jgi:hypothetical protein
MTIAGAKHRLQVRKHEKRETGTGRHPEPTAKVLRPSEMPEFGEILRGTCPEFAEVLRIHGPLEGVRFLDRSPFS